MKTVQIRMPDEIHDMIKIRTVKEKETMNKLINKYILKGMLNEKMG